MSRDYQATIQEYLGHAAKHVVDMAIFELNHALQYSVMTIFNIAMKNAIQVKVMRGGRTWSKDYDLTDQTIDATYLESLHNAAVMWFISIKEGEV